MSKQVRRAHRILDTHHLRSHNDLCKNHNYVARDGVRVCVSTRNALACVAGLGGTNRKLRAHNSSPGHDKGDANPMVGTQLALQKDDRCNTSKDDDGAAEPENKRR